MRLKWLLLLLVLHQAFQERQCEPLIAGEWHPIKDPWDPNVRKTGEFAVAEYKKEKKAVLLTFKGVISGEFQVMSGVKYRQQVEGMEVGEGKTYEAVVWKKPCEGPMALTSFNPAR